ncbi:MAG: glycosyltransferase [Rhizobiaceae bacterium]|nr:glycosyltransferase [Rhizobiaceae bacterium]
MAAPRVLCFGRFSDATPGGIQRHVEHLLNGLKDQVDFVNLVPSRTWRSETSERFGVPTVARAGINVDGSMVLSPGLPFSARTLHRQKPFDLVHLHFPDPMSHLAAMALPAVPRVITWHADIFRHRAALRLYQPFLRRAAETAAAIIVPTQAHIDNSPVLSVLPDKGKIRIIPFGFDLERFTRPAQGLAGLRRRFPGRIVFSLGRHVYYKGFDVLLKAIARLPADVSLVLGGTGPLTAELQDLAARTSIGGRVHFVGLVDDDALPAYYQLCDVFCLPAVSRAEAFGIVQVEAMAAGRPVISTKLGNGVDLVNRDGETGFTVEPGDPQALADALSRLLDDPGAAAELGRTGRERALTEYGLERMARETLDTYRDVLGR